jgi:hypothetical protein
MAANQRQRIVFKQKLSRLGNFAVEKQADRFLDGRVDGASHAAQGIFALQAAFGVLNDMLAHFQSP